MTNTTLMEFPCKFAVKVIGSHSSSFINDVKQITLKHFPNFQDSDLVQKESGKSNYLALTVSVMAQSQPMLDDYYRDLTKISDVKMVL